MAFFFFNQSNALPLFVSKVIIVLIIVLNLINQSTLKILAVSFLVYFRSVPDAPKSNQYGLVFIPQNISQVQTTSVFESLD